MPDEILKELVGILLLNHHSCRSDDVLRILNQFPSFWRELMDVDWRMIENILKCLVDLVVCRQTTIPESLDHAEQHNLITKSVQRRT
jgi:hypothetical protein